MSCTSEESIGCPTQTVTICAQKENGSAEIVIDYLENAPVNLTNYGVRVAAYDTEGGTLQFSFDETTLVSAVLRITRAAANPTLRYRFLPADFTELELGTYFHTLTLTPPGGVSWRLWQGPLPLGA